MPRNANTVTTVVNLSSTSVTGTYRRTTRNRIISPMGFGSPKRIIVTNRGRTIRHTNTTYGTTNTGHTLPLPIDMPSRYTLVGPTTSGLTMRLTGVAFGTPAIPIIGGISIGYRAGNSTVHSTLMHRLCGPIR